MAPLIPKLIFPTKLPFSLPPDAFPSPPSDAFPVNGVTPPTVSLTLLFLLTLFPDSLLEREDLSRELEGGEGRFRRW